jgi:ectoine hydroxylase-related dioxygenase (phytanoyl-CoA dioxygenase family)
VPGSHYSGRDPNDPREPTFEGRGPVSICVKAGDGYLQHPQVWHRGAPNTSDRTRYISGMAWGRRFVAQRFYPFLNYRLPDWLMDMAKGNERLLRVLGKHGKGAYG